MKTFSRLLSALLLVWFTIASPVRASDTPDRFRALPEKGMVTMIDLGAKKCIPCKMMAPILEKLEKTYKGQAAIVFIDVWEHRDQAQRFGIQAIPTQIFFDKEGTEVFRHTGFLGEKDIQAQLRKLGVAPLAPQKNQDTP